MKIWFQNRRTKWKKQENISNSEASEHKIGGDKYVTSARSPTARVLPPKVITPTAAQSIVTEHNVTMREVSRLNEASAPRLNNLASSSAPEVMTAVAQQMHHGYSASRSSTDGASVKSNAMPRLRTPSPLGGADCVGGHDTSSKSASELREPDNYSRCNGDSMHTQLSGHVVCSLANGK